MTPTATRGNNPPLDALAALATPYSEALIIKNDPLAISVGTRYFHLCKGFDDFDAVQIARIGLIRAARKYDPTKISPHTLAPISFSSYAVPFIRGEILHYLRDRGHLLRIPRRLKERAARVQKLAHSRGVTPREIALENGWDWHELEEVIEIHVVYPDAEFFEETIAVSGNNEGPSRQLMQSLGKLPSWQSDLMIRHYYRRESLERIARDLDRPLESVKTWIEDAQAQLKQDESLATYATAA